ncbi:methyltransferase domain-containing protein [Niveomyces insectorum RCEF 264]|uniref:Methyltransferase domain-containing protein n=1 Tax=Niveomyces insectorum RCEF 264 TaxID=1081102 RepID=A0A167XQA7_9HYPO|nr:methyltransferase domain-containing protein [Niveomyces insectorum RCEF 264]
MSTPLSGSTAGSAEPHKPVPQPEAPVSSTEAGTIDANTAEATAAIGDAEGSGVATEAAAAAAAAVDQLNLHAPAIPESSAAVVPEAAPRATAQAAETAAETSDKPPSSVPAPAPAPAAAPGVIPDSASTRSHNAMSGYSVDLSVDTEPVDADQPLGSFETLSSSRSVNSTVYHFVEEFGRTFHRYKEGKYYLPNDEQEQNRLDLQHAIAKQMLEGQLGLAPLDAQKPLRVLDIGTGTGLWAIEFAEKYPEADVLGTDLSPIQPEYVPANCRFEIDDADDEWTWQRPFDYVHGRYIVPFLRNVPAVLRQAYAHLAPGGFVELFEGPMLFEAVDGSLAGTALQAWNDGMLAGVRRLGRDPLAALQLRANLVDAGFVGIAERRYALPINPWPKGSTNKLLGAMEMTNLLEVAHGITAAVFVKALGWTPEDVDALLAKVRKDLRDRRIHAYLPVVVIYGRKPEESSK